MRVTCPECQSVFPLAAGLLDAEAKRFGVALGASPPELARALVSYLALHKPAKTALRLAKATRIVEEINALVAAGEVRRGGVPRPATPALWARGIETMLDSRAKLRLPLSSHGYLTEVVAALADQADAAGERQRETDLRVGKHLQHVGPSPVRPGEDVLTNRRRWLAQQLSYGAIDEPTYQAELAKLREVPA